MPFDIYTLDEHGLAHHSLIKFKMLVRNNYIQGDILEKIEDELIPALEYIDNWEPSDADLIENNSCGIPYHDGCK